MQTNVKEREADGANVQLPPTELQRLPAKPPQNPKGAVHLSVWRDAKQSRYKDTVLDWFGFGFLIAIFLLGAAYLTVGGSLGITSVEMGSETVGVVMHRTSTPPPPREEEGSGPYP